MHSSCDYFRRKRTEKPMKRTIDQPVQTEQRVDRTLYIDDPPPKPPSAATRAFVRNLGSTSVQQHLAWDSQSLHTQRTNSDLCVSMFVELSSRVFLFRLARDYQSMATRDFHRKQYPDDPTSLQAYPSPKLSPKKHESRGTGMHSPLSTDRHSTSKR